jgi:hypothetical protein
MTVNLSVSILNIPSGKIDTDYIATSVQRALTHWQRDDDTQHMAKELSRRQMDEWLGTTSSSDQGLLALEYSYGIAVTWLEPDEAGRFRHCRCLIDVPDPVIRKSLLARIRNLGMAAIPLLDDLQMEAYL